ncbi:aldehyde dehydrogenase [Planococcus sp. YIM B11945]|uniref:aldehyde dehydrogenase n=1 Tax=Planococcus sp. YIM B11945 TaxID=3435410 RepID=UPI003D7D8D20
MEDHKYEQIFVNNEFVTPLSGETYETINPATGEVWTLVAKSSEADVDLAVEAASNAFEGEWRSYTGTQRSHLLRKLGDLIRRDTEKLARLESRDNGKLYSELLNGEIPNVAEWFYFYAGIADKMYGSYISHDPNLFSVVKKEPVGVVGALVPWNSPLLMIAWKAAPALAAGNTMVIKPADQTSVTALEFGKLVAEAGFPPGVVNVVTGGAEVGAAIVGHPKVDKIAFTGSSRTAQVISKGSVGNLKRLSFELGGKAPHIIFEDADLDQALIAATSGIFINAGQTCAAGSRLLVSSKIYDDFVGKLVEKAKTIRVGDPMDPKSHMGPQSLEAQVEKIEEFIEVAKQEGGNILTGGRRLAVEGFENGFFFEPTIISGLSEDSYVCREEIFGPVLVVIPFDTEEEAIRIANNSQYGLTAGLWTNDVRKAHRVADAIRAGIVWINTYRKVLWQVPYGGFKMSGYGRENGLEVMELYTEAKTVMMDINTSRVDPYA